MKYETYMDILDKAGYRLVGDIYRDKKGFPKCCNEVFQDLVVRQQRAVIMPREYELYGRLVMTLVNIVLNNHKFKFQDPDIREECRTEAYCDILSGLPRYFDANKGSTAYAYGFRIAYTAMIHVLQRMNIRNELSTNLIERMEDAILDCGHKVVTENCWAS